ncbi:MAG: hypothetical protein U9Q74_15710 [Gemmatimonadota bacterium]|nr:hypothetical protein [Gemmatimonadota bacterium]
MFHPVRSAHALALVALAAASLTACSEITDGDSGSGSYSISSDSPSGSSSVRTPNGTVLGNVTSATVMNGYTSALVQRDGDCWILVSVGDKTGTVTLDSASNAIGPHAYYQCTGDGYPDANLAGTVTLVSRSVDTKGQSGSFQISLAGAHIAGSGAAANASRDAAPGGTQAAAAAAGFSGDISASFTASTGSGGSGGSGGPGGGGSGGSGSVNLVCPGSLPSGYQCLNNNGQYAPGKYNLPVLHGTWVESSFQVCMTLNSNGTSAFRYKSGAPATSGQWGALVNSSGQTIGSAGTYTVFTGATDPQIKLLVFNTASNGWVGWGFQKGSCPW